MWHEYFSAGARSSVSGVKYLHKASEDVLLWSWSAIYGQTYRISQIKNTAQED